MEFKKCPDIYIRIKKTSKSREKWSKNLWQKIVFFNWVTIITIFAHKLYDIYLSLIKYFSVKLDRPFVIDYLFYQNNVRL